MKLWAKISALCASILLIVVGICCSLLLFQSRSTILRQTQESTISQHKNLQTSFDNMLSYYKTGNLSDSAERSYVIYCFSRFADDTTVLVSLNNTLYSHVSIKPEQLLPIDTKATFNASPSVLWTSIDGRNLLIIGSRVSNYSAYFVYTVKDVTNVYSGLTQMAVQFAIISGVCILTGILLLILLVRKTTKPLKQLAVSARQITGGAYEERASIHTKDEVGQLADDFNLMAASVQHHVEELQQTAERQKLFIGGLTHEYKTPLTSMIGYSETMLYTKLSEESQQTCLQYIYEQCQWLERLTQKLLKLITLQQDILLKSESVPELLETVRCYSEETFRKRGIILQIECSMDALVMDTDLMTSLLINLVDNASKASEAGQTVLLCAHDGMLEVTDSGNGIEKSELSKITEPFYMVDRSRSKSMGGSGLGLALAQSIAKAHGARLVFESEIGKGTTVKVIFPVNKTITI